MLYILCVLAGGIIAALGLCIFSYKEYKSYEEMYKAGREDERGRIERKLLKIVWKARREPFDYDKVQVFLNEIEKLIKEEK